MSYGNYISNNNERKINIEDRVIDEKKKYHERIL